MGLALCKRLGRAVLVNADAMQLFRGAPIATNQASSAEQAEVAHRLLGVLDAREETSALRFVRMADAAVREVLAEGRAAVVVGGTVHYVMALALKGRIGEEEEEEKEEEERKRFGRDERSHGERLMRLREVDAAAAARIDPRDERKVARALQMAEEGRSQTERFANQGKAELRYERTMVVWVEPRGGDEELCVRVEERTREMARRGLAEEARRMREEWGEQEPDCERGIWQAIGLKEFLGTKKDGEREGIDAEEEAIQRIVVSTVRYARKQQKMLRNTMASVLDHVRAEGSAKEVEALAEWANGGELSLPMVAATGKKADLERVDCCGKTVFGAAQIAAHRRSKGHKAMEKKKKRAKREGEEPRV